MTEPITDAINAVFAESAQEPDPFFELAAEEVFRMVEEDEAKSKAKGAK